MDPLHLDVDTTSDRLRGRSASSSRHWKTLYRNERLSVSRAEVTVPEARYFARIRLDRQPSSVNHPVRFPRCRHRPAAAQVYRDPGFARTYPSLIDEPWLLRKTDWHSGIEDEAIRGYPLTWGAVKAEPETKMARSFRRPQSDSCPGNARRRNSSFDIRKRSQEAETDGSRPSDGCRSSFGRGGRKPVGNAAGQACSATVLNERNAGWNHLIRSRSFHERKLPERT